MNTRINLPLVTNEDETIVPIPITFRPRTPADAIAAARATIERDFYRLAEQQPRLLRLALNEAEALAWASGFPALVFPILAQEKAGNLAAWHARQQSVRHARPTQAFAA